MKHMPFIALIALGLIELSMNINSLTSKTVFSASYYPNNQEPSLSGRLTLVPSNFKPTPIPTATSTAESKSIPVSIPAPISSSFQDWLSNMSANFIGGVIGTFVGFGLGIASDRRTRKHNAIQNELKVLVLLKQEIINNREKSRSVINGNDALIDFQFFNSAWSAARFFSELEPNLYLVLDEIYKRTERISVVQGRFLDPSLWGINGSERKKIMAAMENFILGEIKNLEKSFNEALILVEEREKILKQ